MRLTLYRRGNIYWARGSEGGWKFRKSTRHTSERKARAVADRWERELADPDHYRANKATVASAIERWQREIKLEMNPETRRFYDPKIRHVGRLLGSVPLSRLTHEKVVSYIETREEEGAHPHSVHRELTALRLTLKSAQRAREFNRDPKTVLPRYRSGYEPRKDDWVEPDVIWAAIRILPPHRGAAVAWCIATACDYSNIFTAERSDVNETDIFVRGTKTGTRARFVPRIKVMEPFLAYALKHAEPEPATLLFRSWRSMAPDLRRACVRAKVKQFTARSLRHSAATWMVKAGVPYEVAAKFLGHGSTAMLQRVYGDLSPVDAGRLIDERLS